MKKHVPFYYLLNYLPLVFLNKNLKSFVTRNLKGHNISLLDVPLSSPSNIPCKMILTMCYLGIGGTNKYKIQNTKKIQARASRLINKLSVRQLTNVRESTFSVAHLGKEKFIYTFLANMSTLR